MKICVIVAEFAIIITLCIHKYIKLCFICKDKYVK